MGEIVVAHPSGAALPQAIQLLHMAIAEHPDPAAKQTLGTCLANMLKVQAMDMQQQQGQQSPQRAIVNRLAG
jgi:hypothetical protein